MKKYLDAAILLCFTLLTMAAGVCSGQPAHVFKLDKLPEKDKVMQPFFTTKPTGEGTGLGLSLSYDIAEKGHGGSITVDTNENEFAEFIVSLPL